MSTMLHPMYTLVNLALLVWGLLVWRRTRRFSTFVIVAVTFGLVYDNGILAIGNLLGRGRLLHGLSVPRFVLHQLMLPWVIWTAFQQVRRVGHPWAQGRTPGRLITLLCVVVVILGVLTRIVPMDLQLVQMDGVNRYVDEGTVGPPIVSIVSVGFAGVMGVFLWRKNR